MSVKKRNIKKIIIAIILIAVVVVTTLGVMKYIEYSKNKLTGGDGIYYYQQDNGKTLKFNKDNTFSYSVVTDDTADVSTGTWTQNKDEISVTFENGSEVSFVKTPDDYIYRKGEIFKGITSDAKLLNNIYVLEENGEKVERICFMNDGTVDYEIIGDSKMSHGTYTRVGDILIVRRSSAPYSFNKVVEITERYLVLENGITKEIYSKAPAENIAK